MKIRLKLLITISIFVLTYASYYWGIPAIIDIENKGSKIENLAKKEFGAQIKLDKPKLKMGLIPSVWFEADYLGMEDKNYEPLSVLKPKIKIRLLPLLIGKINIAYISCDKINANLKIDKNFKIYIGNYLFIKSSNSKLSIEDSKMDIGEYKINVKDELQNKNILFKGEYLTLKRFNSKKYLNIATNSSIKIDDREAKIDANINFRLPFKQGLDNNKIIFNGSIANLNLADFSPIIKRLSNNKILKASGILNIEADTKSISSRTSRIRAQMAADNLAIISKNANNSIIFKDKLKIKTNLDVSKNKLIIKEFEVLSGKMNLDITGKVNRISSDNPYLNLKVNVEKARTEDFIALLPPTNLKNVDINLPALKKYGYYSDLSGNILIKGDSQKPKVTGTFIATNGYVVKPLNIPKATVTLNFKGEEMFMDIFVPVSDSEKVRVKGDVELYGNKNANLDITSTPNADLETTTFILNPLHEIFYFDIGPIPVMQLKGHGNINLKTSGNKKNPTLKGVLNFKNTTASFNGLNANLENVDGSLYFNNQDTHFITKKAFLDKKPIKIDGKCSVFGVLDFNILSDGQNLSKMIDILKHSPMLTPIIKNVPIADNPAGKINLSLNLKGQVKKIDEFMLGKTISATGIIKLMGNDVTISSLQLPIKSLTGNIRFKNTDADFDLYSNINKSKMNIKGKIVDNKIHSKIKLDDVNFTYMNMPIKIFSGNLEINNDKIILYRINALVDSMPLLVDGFITNIFNKPDFNIYLNSKPTQKFIDKNINKNSIYPLRIKGDINYSARISGTRDSLDTKTEINLQEDSNIYYMGSTLGDATSPIRIYLDTNISKNSILVKNFQYDKLIASQNNKEFVSQQLNAKGRIYYNKQNITLENFRVKTLNPTDSKIFNILFKKPLIKEGLFNSNISINGPVNSPKLIGYLNFTGINIPLFDTTIKDISLDFTKNLIDMSAKGDLLANKITLFANMENRLSAPFILNDVDIYLGNLDINQVVTTLNKLDVRPNINTTNTQHSTPNITDIIIKQGKIKAESVFVKNIFAKNFTANFSLNEKLIFDVDNFKFTVADGDINGDFRYNLLNSKTELDINVNDVNANSISEALFDLPNQIFGSLSGQANLTCNGKTHKTCMNTLSGNGGFRVKDGRMPKLGSMEYLLKAANLVKSGITGLTINSLVELLSPLKTGQFENINGMFAIKSGIADDIQIFSKGKDLSLFITGTYNFSTLIANMEVFGRISKRISNVLGPIGNTSLNTLFNTIPGLNLDEANKADFIKNFNKIPGFELNDKTYRIFSAEIYGDINGENYVQSFKWVE